MGTFGARYRATDCKAVGMEVAVKTVASKVYKQQYLGARLLYKNAVNDNPFTDQLIATKWGFMTGYAHIITSKFFVHKFGIF
jgi:hypothetical protein